MVAILVLVFVSITTTELPDPVATYARGRTGPTAPRDGPRRLSAQCRPTATTSSHLSPAQQVRHQDLPTDTGISLVSPFLGVGGADRI